MQSFMLLFIMSQKIVFYFIMWQLEKRSDQVFPEPALICLGKGIRQTGEGASCLM